MKQNNKKFNNAIHKFVGVLDKCANNLLIQRYAGYTMPSLKNAGGD